MNLFNLFFFGFLCFSRPTSSPTHSHVFASYNFNWTSNSINVTSVLQLLSRPIISAHPLYDEATAVTTVLLPHFHSHGLADRARCNCSSSHQIGRMCCERIQPGACIFARPPNARRNKFLRIYTGLF